MSEYESVYRFDSLTKDYEQRYTRIDQLMRCANQLTEENPAPIKREQCKETLRETAKAGTVEDLYRAYLGLRQEDPLENNRDQASDLRDEIAGEAADPNKPVGITEMKHCSENSAVCKYEPFKDSEFSALNGVDTYIDPEMNSSRAIEINTALAYITGYLTTMKRPDAVTQGNTIKDIATMSRAKTPDDMNDKMADLCLARQSKNDKGEFLAITNLAGEQVITDIRNCYVAGARDAIYDLAPLSGHGIVYKETNDDLGLIHGRNGHKKVANER